MLYGVKQFKIKLEASHYFNITSTNLQFKVQFNNLLTYCITGLVTQQDLQIHQESQTHFDGYLLTMT